MIFIFLQVFFFKRIFLFQLSQVFVIVTNLSVFQVSYIFDNKVINIQTPQQNEPKLSEYQEKKNWLVLLLVQFVFSRYSRMLFLENVNITIFQVEFFLDNFSFKSVIFTSCANINNEWNSYLYTTVVLILGTKCKWNLKF